MTYFGSTRAVDQAIARTETDKPGSARPDGSWFASLQGRGLSPNRVVKPRSLGTIPSAPPSATPFPAGDVVREASAVTSVQRAGGLSRLCLKQSSLEPAFAAISASLAKTMSRLFADGLFRLLGMDAEFPAQVADVEAAQRPVARIQILLLDAFKKL
jgi:hypothetical protein